MDVEGIDNNRDDTRGIEVVAVGGDPKVLWQLGVGLVRVMAVAPQEGYWPVLRV